MRPFEDVNGSIRFKPNATFDKAVALYRFDAELRNLLFSKILRTFAVIVPTTLPIEQRTRVGLLLFIRIRFSKQPLDYLEILKLLKSRGLIIRDESMAIECLKVVSYFRLDNYFHPMESDKIRHIFKPNSYFENAVDLYEFDRDLRELIFTAIQAIEIALRSTLLSNHPNVDINYLKIEQGIIDNELFKKLENSNIWEFRTIFSGNCYRLFSFWDTENETLVIATHGIVKKTQKTLPKEIAKAEDIRKEYFKKKKEE